MTALINLYLRLSHRIEYGIGTLLMPTLARFLFAAIFGFFYWNAAMAKTGADYAGLWSPSAAALKAFFPQVSGPEAASSLQQMLTLAGTWAELVLPVLIVIGLFTRIAAFGMIVLLGLQTAAVILGHGLSSGNRAMGAWFDAVPNSQVMDQTALWFLLLFVIFFRGAGPLSVDGLLKRWLNIY